MSKPYIGIKRVLYDEPMTALPEGVEKFNGAYLKTLLAKVGTEGATIKEVKNVHKDTWGYEEPDPSVNEYINQLTGQPYYRDMEQAGVPTANFTLGEYSLQEKADLQGGEVIDGVWHRKDMLKPVNKTIFVQTKTGHWIVMPNANIIGKGNFVEKNIGLSVAAVPVEPDVEGLSAEMWVSAEEME